MAKTQPRIPEISASPLLNHPVIDKPLSDPVFQQTEPVATPPQQQPQPTVSSPPPPQTGIETESPDQTSHLSPPRPTVDDPNLRTMTFEAPTGGIEEGVSGEGGGKQEIKLPKAEVTEFAKVIVQIGSMYIPVFLSKFAKIKTSELELGEHEGVFPPGTVAFFKQLNENTEKGIAITDEEQKMLLSALKAYLEWKNIEATNPGTALAIALGAVGLRLGINTVEAMAENRRIYKNFLSHYPIFETGEEPVSPDEKKEQKEV